MFADFHSDNKPSKDPLIIEIDQIAQSVQSDLIIASKRVIKRLLRLPIMTRQFHYIFQFPTHDDVSLLLSRQIWLEATYPTSTQKFPLEIVMNSSPVLVFGENEQRVCQAKIFTPLATVHLPNFRQCLIKLSSVFARPFIFIENHLEIIDNAHSFNLIKLTVLKIEAIFHHINLLLHIKFTFQEGQADLNSELSPGKINPFESFRQVYYHIRDKLIEPSKELLKSMVTFLKHSLLVHQSLKNDHQSKYICLWRSKANDVSQRLLLVLSHTPYLIRWFRQPEYVIRQDTASKFNPTVDNLIPSIQNFIVLAEAFANQFGLQTPMGDAVGDAGRLSQQRGLDIYFEYPISILFRQVVSDPWVGPIFLNERATFLAPAAIPVFKMARLISNYFLPCDKRNKTNNQSSALIFAINLNQFTQTTKLHCFLEFFDKLLLLVQELFCDAIACLECVSPCEASRYYDTITSTYQTHHLNDLKSKIEKLERFSSSIKNDFDMLFNDLTDSSNQDLIKALQVDREWLEVWCRELDLYIQASTPTSKCASFVVASNAMGCLIIHQFPIPRFTNGPRARTCNTSSGYKPPLSGMES
ncbi:hypothetical protein O181_033511 [Austropuccinia psidii MF-1]|uniref:Uncharacterized protein n=1 Tax=Austropuccinia psidii MF-1 TaxID=1389203 RepID=A0A9Q3H760_9BASI|nr:hypothetical protein [Austropuccinia psidii MF-1]